MTVDKTPDDTIEKIKILATDDEKIKSFGELLTNDSSRKILQLLFGAELTATQIAQKTETSLQLVKYHLNKLQDLGVVKISKIEKNSKAQDMKVYTAEKFSIVIVPPKLSEKTRESKLLVRSFRHIYRVVGLGIATGASALLSLSQIQQTQTIQNGQPQAEDLAKSDPTSEQSSFDEELRGAVEAPISDTESAVKESQIATEPTAEAPWSSDEQLAMTLQDAAEAQHSADEAPSSVAEPTAEAPQSTVEQFTMTSENADEIVAEAPSPDEMVAEAPSPDEMVAEAPSPDEMVAEAPSPDEMVAEAPSPDESDTRMSQSSDESIVEATVAYTDSEITALRNMTDLNSSAVETVTSISISDLFWPLIAITAVLGCLTVFYLVRHIKRQSS